jgi:hypothetical protein
MYGSIGLLRDRRDMHQQAANHEQRAIIRKRNIAPWRNDHEQQQQPFRVPSTQENSSLRMVSSTQKDLLTASTSSSSCESSISYLPFLPSIAAGISSFSPLLAPRYQQQHHQQQKQPLQPNQQHPWVNSHQRLVATSPIVDTTTEMPPRSCRSLDHSSGTTTTTTTTGTAVAALATSSLTATSSSTPTSSSSAATLFPLSSDSF